MKVIFSTIGGIICSLGLFYLMAQLINTGKMDMAKAPPSVSIDYVRVKHNEAQTDTIKRQLPPKPQPPQQAPQVQKVAVQEDQQNQPTPEDLNLEMPNNDFGLKGGSGPYLAKGGGGGISGSIANNSDETPLVRIDPEYPINARMKGIEGNVKVSFNIGADGRPIAIEIDESSPPRVFDKSVTKAVMRWKYKPRMKDGKPVDSPDRLSVVFPFKLTEEE